MKPTLSPYDHFENLGITPPFSKIKKRETGRGKYKGMLIARGDYRFDTLVDVSHPVDWEKGSWHLALGGGWGWGGGQLYEFKNLEFKFRPCLFQLIWFGFSNRQEFNSSEPLTSSFSRQESKS